MPKKHKTSAIVQDHHFASDNTSGICPEAWDALAEANQGRAASYGDDPWTQQACDLIRRVFEKPDAEVFFVSNGTVANSLALAALCQSYSSVICHDRGHIATEECNAPVFFSGGATLLAASCPDAKLTPGAAEKLILKCAGVHEPVAAAISLTQSTELGTLYTVAEIRALAAVAKRHGLAVHMDGARLANAFAALRERPGSITPADATWRAGVDVLCFGGTKNGMNATEAVVFFNPKLAAGFGQRCKQAGQVPSKMRFLSAQWVGMLKNGAWLRNGAHANKMTAKLAAALRDIPGLRFAAKPEVNALFVEIPPAAEKKLKREGWHFHNFGDPNVYRLMCSWDTREDDITRFAEAARRAVGGK